MYRYNNKIYITALLVVAATWCYKIFIYNKNFEQKNLIVRLQSPSSLRFRLLATRKASIWYFICYTLYNNKIHIMALLVVAATWCYKIFINNKNFEQKNLIVRLQSPSSICFRLLATRKASIYYFIIVPSILHLHSLVFYFFCNFFYKFI